MTVKTPPAIFDFGPLAERYDNWYESAEGDMYDRLEKRAVAHLLPKNTYGKRLLDVGCGTGHWSEFFSEQGFTVTGVDISRKMINIAYEKSIRDSSLIIADAHNLPFQNGCFDVAVAITTLEFVRAPEVVISEMVRCLRQPGSVMVVGVLNTRARINRRRKASNKTPYRDAQLFSPYQLKKILTSYGETNVITTAFVPRGRWLLHLSPLFTTIGHLFHLPYGAFIVGRVML